MLGNDFRLGAFIGVSCNYANPSTPVADRSLIEYGHGLFEDYGAPDRWTWVHEITHYSDGVVWGINWRGLSRFEILDATSTLMWNNNRIAKVQAGLLQSFASKVAAQRLVRLILEAEEDAFGIAGLLPAPADVPGRYLGISLGSIIGGGYVPYMQYSRSVLLVGGSCFSFIFGRSYLFNFYRAVMDQQYYNRADLRIAMTTWQTVVDQFETSGWTHDAEGGSPWRGLEALQSVANGDSTVTTIAARIQARSLNASLLGPALFDAFGLMEVDSPIDVDADPTVTRVLFNTEYTKAAALIPQSSALPPRTSAHLCLPQNSFITAQSGAFLSRGVIVDNAATCPAGAPCGLVNGDWQEDCLDV
jgi:hypothetical protein